MGVGGSGIGRATAIVFGREGAKVEIADYNRDGGEQTVRMIKDAGGQALFIEANVAFGLANPEMKDRLRPIIERLLRL